MIGVLVVDDHPLVRAGLGQLISSTDDLVVVGSAGTGEAAVALAAELRPDVVLMDIELPALDGIGAARAIIEERPGTVVVMLSTYDDPKRVEAAIDAGVSGFLNKSISPQALLACIRIAPHEWVSYVAAGAPTPTVSMRPPLAARAAKLLEARALAKAPSA